jgi:hypothetical protein
LYGRLVTAVPYALYEPVELMFVFTSVLMLVDVFILADVFILGVVLYVDPLFQIP